MQRKGFLLVLMHPPLAFEEEFNAWYDLEHLPERMSVPGFETGLRYASVGPAPRYMAMYDLSRFAVLESEAYRRVGGANSSPWSKRVLARARAYRSAGEQIYPGTASTPTCPRVELLRFRGVEAGAVDGLVATLRDAFEDQPQTIQLRVFAYATEHGAGTDVLAFVAATGPSTAARLGAASRSLDLVNAYVPLPPP